MSDKKITRNRPTHYPRQVVIMASEETYQAITETAATENVSKSVIARRWLEAGQIAEEGRPRFSIGGYVKPGRLIGD